VESDLHHDWSTDPGTFDRLLVLLGLLAIAGGRHKRS
jgi:hypothetical protein